MPQWVGYKWLEHQYGIQSVQSLTVESCIGATRKTLSDNGVRHEFYLAGMRPADTLADHLTFALKHEGVNLEFLARLFDVVPEAEIVDWINSERTGQYARRTGFLWEWLKGRELEGVHPQTVGNYIEALDPEQYLVATHVVNNPRWRVRDNLPGNRFFCPMVRRTPAVLESEQYDCAQRLDELQAEYGTDILMKSAVWLTIKESRASFQIEHEEDQENRIRRFASVMEQRCGEAENPLDRKELEELQRGVIGEHSVFKHFGLRKSPVFVGAVSGYREVVHYVAPGWEDLECMLSGLELFVAKTRGAPPITRAAVTSFGFVYIHPLIDGNGRVHRFLINDMLRRDGAVPKPYILPISATITHKPQDLAQYDSILESFSKPLMGRFGAACEFTDTETLYEDGVRSNFSFSGYGDALPAWRYPDLTDHVEYMTRLIDNTISREMRAEAIYLQAWEAARGAVKEVVEGPDRDIDRIIRSIQGNNGDISNKLIKEYPVLEKEGLAERVKQAVASAFATERGAAPKP